MQAKEREHAAEVRPKYIGKSYLYDQADEFKKQARRLFVDSAEADESTRRLLRMQALKLLRDAKRFDAGAELAEAPELSEIPFK